MKIIMIGGGKVGEVLCSELSTIANDIVLIDKNPEKLDRLINKFDITGLVGNGASYDTLVEAGTETADMFIAVTEKDEINIIAAILAKQLGVDYTVARVRNPEYSMQLQFVRESLGISLLINPDLAAARDIARNFKYPSALSVESLAGNRVSLIGLEIEERSPVIGSELKGLRTKFGGILVCVIQRNGESFIPTGSTIIEAGDIIYITGAYEDVSPFLDVLHKKAKPIKSTFIVGGGRIAHYLLHLLNNSGIKSKVLETNLERCEHLSVDYPSAEIVHADGTDHDILAEEMLSEYDSFVSLTGIDEENIVLSAFAQQCGVEKVVTKMSRTGILKVLRNIDLQSIVSPKQLVASEIIQFVKSRANTQGSNVEALYRIADNQVEALQFRIKRGSRICEKPLSDLPLKSDMLIAYILRGHELIYPDGSDQLQPHDRVIVITTDKSLDDIDDILA